MNSTRRIWLFLLLFGVPIVFLYTLSKGKNNSENLPYFSQSAIATENALNDSLEKYKESDKYDFIVSLKKGLKEQKIKDFVFYDEDSTEVSSATTKGKTLVVNTLIPSCPYYCPILQSELQYLVYDKLKGRPDFNDLLFISHLIDTSGKVPGLTRFNSEQKGIDKKSWKIVTGDTNSIFDFQLPTGNIIERNCDTTITCIGGKPYYQMIMLVDRNRYVRGLYQGNQTQLIERMRGDIRKLFIEYKQEDKKSENK